MKKLISIFIIAAAIIISIDSNLFSKENDNSSEKYSFGNLSGTTTLNLKCDYRGLFSNHFHAEYIKVRLRSITPPYNVIDSQNVQYLNYPIDGWLNPVVLNIPSNGNYYITFWHKSGFETCSKEGGEYFTIGSTKTYNFTADSSKTFGENAIRLQQGQAAYWVGISGDVTQDGVVDGSDLVIWEYEIYWFANGDADMDGNDIVDGYDFAPIDDGALNYRVIRTPWLLY